MAEFRIFELKSLFISCELNILISTSVIAFHVFLWQWQLKKLSRYPLFVQPVLAVFKPVDLKTD